MVGSGSDITPCGGRGRPDGSLGAEVAAEQAKQLQWRVLTTVSERDPLGFKLLHNECSVKR